MKNPQQAKAAASPDYAELRQIKLPSADFPEALERFFKTDSGRALIKCHETPFCRGFYKLTAGYDPGESPATQAPLFIRDYMIFQIAFNATWAPIDTPENRELFKIWGMTWPKAKIAIADKIKVIARTFDAVEVNHSAPTWIIDFFILSNWLHNNHIFPGIPGNALVPPFAFWSDQAIADYISFIWKLAKPKSAGAMQQWRRRLKLKTAAIILIRKFHAKQNGTFSLV